MNQKSGGFTWSQDLMNSMMFLYKTRKCPMNKRGLCNFGDFCFDSHKDIVRRRPMKKNGEQWNYNPDDICIHSRNNKCQDYKRCHKCHNKQEHNFHPKIYKTKLCQHQSFKSTGICSKGLQCWNYHDQRDRRDHQCNLNNLEDTGQLKNTRPPTIYLNWAESMLVNAKERKLRYNVYYSCARIMIENFYIYMLI